jgi:hypothetical protein
MLALLGDARRAKPRNSQAPGYDAAMPRAGVANSSEAGQQAFDWEPAARVLDLRGPDPYEARRRQARDLLEEFDVGEDHAFELVLGSGSAAAARRLLVRRWWRGEVRRHDDE